MFLLHLMIITFTILQKRILTIDVNLQSEQSKAKLIVQLLQA